MERHFAAMVWLACYAAAAADQTSIAAALPVLRDLVTREHLIQQVGRLLAK